MSGRHVRCTQLNFNAAGDAAASAFSAYTVQKPKLGRVSSFDDRGLTLRVLDSGRLAGGADFYELPEVKPDCRCRSSEHI